MTKRYTFIRCILMTIVIGAAVTPATAGWSLFKSKDPLAREGEALSWYMRGLLERNFDKPKAALHSFRKAAIAAGAGNVALELNIALCYLQQSKIDDAMPHLAKAASLAPRDPRPTFILAYCASSKNDTARATVLLEELVRTVPEFIPAVNLLAEIYIRAGNLDGARPLYEKLIAEGQAQLRDYYNLGVIQFKKNAFKEAAEQFKQVVEHEPDNVNVHFALASIYDRLGDRKGVIEELEAICSTNPKDKVICYNLASLYQMQGNLDKAVDILRKVIASDPVEIDARIMAGIVLLRMGQCNDALTYFLEVEKLAPERTEVIFYTGLAYDGEGKFNEAIAYLERAKPFFRNNELLHFQLGVMYDQVGDDENAFRAFKEVLRINKDSDEALNYLGYLYAERGVNLDEALVMLKRAVELKANVGAYWDSLGWVWYKKRKYNEALACLEKALTFDGGDPLLLDHISDIYWELGRKQEAVDALRKAAQKKAGFEKKLSEREKVISR